MAVHGVSIERFVLSAVVMTTIIIQMFYDRGCYNDHLSMCLYCIGWFGGYTPRQRDTSSDRS